MYILQNIVARGGTLGSDVTLNSYIKSEISGCGLYNAFSGTSKGENAFCRFKIGEVF